MFRRVLVLITAAAIIGCGDAYAQETSQGPGVVEVTVIPAGAAFISSKNGAPSFGNYGFGTAVTGNFNRVIGIEGEFGGMINIRKRRRISTSFHPALEVIATRRARNSWISSSRRCRSSRWALS